MTEGCCYLCGGQTDVDKAALVEVYALLSLAILVITCVGVRVRKCSL